MEFGFCFAIENSPRADRLRHLFVVQIYRVTVYQENVEHTVLTAFSWRCDEIEMSGRRLKAQKLMKANFVINSSKLSQDIADTCTRHRTWISRYSKEFIYLQYT